MAAETEDVISSISKGCFFFKPKSKDETVQQKTTSKKRKMNVKKNQHDAINYLQTFTHENEGGRERRFHMYESCWNDLSSQIQQVQSSLNESIFRDLYQYVQRIYTNHKNKLAMEIPTAALITGVNIPDHQVFFSTFVDMLKENVTPFVAQLQSKDCSNLKFLIKTAFDSLSMLKDENDGNNDDEESFLSEDEDDMEVTKRRKKSTIFKKYTFTELKLWYELNCMNNISTTLAEESEDMKYDQKPEVMDGMPPVVFIFEDFDRFLSPVLQDFILICSEYITDIPIVLIFGVATAVTTVHRLLPHFVSSKLSIQKFQSQPSLSCLTQVIDKVIITDRNAFKLGPHVFRLLYEHFLYHDFSINNFIRGIKLCVLEHFNNDPTSLMCTKDNDVIQEYIDSCNSKKIENLKRIPSFQSYLERKSEKEQKKIDGDNNLMLKHTKNLIKKLQSQEQIFYPMVKCLFTCTGNLPTHPLGKWLRDAYEFCSISSNITKEKKFDTAMTLLRMLSRDELLPILVGCEEILNDAVISEETISKITNHPLKTVVQSLTEFIGKFDDLDKIVEVTVEEDDDEKKQFSRKSMPVYKSRYEFTQNLKMAVKEKKKETPYEKLRTSIVDFMQSTFQTYLQSPLSMTFHEIFYYDDVRNIQQRLSGTPRIAIQKALSDPSCYLNCKCCPRGSDEIHGSMPDVCILYKLHLESGRLINLYDWLQAFISFIDPSIVDDKKKKSQKKKKIEEQLQARFIRGISELQFLGFIKGTRRKTDHVSRLTWGGC